VGLKWLGHEPDHSLPPARFRIREAKPPRPEYAFMAWYLNKHSCPSALTEHHAMKANSGVEV
jgi:hypothetical protein